MLAKLEEIEERYAEVLAQMGDPDVVSDMSRYRELASEHSHLTPIVETWRELKGKREAVVESQSLLKDEDPDIREMAREEIAELEPAIEGLEQKLQVLMLPRDPNDDKNVIVEIRAGTGGDEAALFAGDLWKMYQRFAEAQGWKTELLDQTLTELGGIKELTASIKGTGVFAALKFESGVHRVQRRPCDQS